MRTNWIKSANEKPEYNISVLVYIPEEDDHITTGMWDISNKWVLLDEYRVPLSEVTYWMPMPVSKPTDQSYTPTTRTEDQENTSGIIRRLQMENYDLIKKYEKCIQTIMKFDAGIISMYDL